MLQVGAIAGLVGQRLARSVNSLRVLVENSFDLLALHRVALLLGRSFPGCGGFGEALTAVLLGALWLGVAIAILVPLELRRDSPQHRHGDGSLKCLIQTKSLCESGIGSKEEKKTRY